MRPLRTAPSKHGFYVTEELLDGSEVEDGGKWALYCHHSSGNVAVNDISILQDKNRQRLWGWAHYSNEWCCYCQEIDQNDRRVTPI